jgi:hypothetical protein
MVYRPPERCVAKIQSPVSRRIKAAFSSAKSLNDIWRCRAVILRRDSSLSIVVPMWDELIGSSASCLLYSVERRVRARLAWPSESAYLGSLRIAAFHTGKANATAAAEKHKAIDSFNLILIYCSWKGPENYVLYP